MEGTLGEIRLFSGNIVPQNWALCNGQEMGIAQNTALYAIIGYSYGGDNRTYFNLPDFRGRSAFSWDSESADYTLNNKISPRLKGGQFAKAISDYQLPEHSHDISIQVSTEDAQESDANNFLAKVLIYNDDEQTDDQLGGAEIKPFEDRSEPVSNMQPFMVVNHIICIRGSLPAID